MWSGLCDVRIDIDRDARAALDADAVCRTTAADVLTEGISNAIRHGGATRVTARLARMDGNLARIWIWDDGEPPRASSKRGLGSRLLDECAVRWSRQPAARRDERTELVADLPLAGHAGIS